MTALPSIPAQPGNRFHVIELGHDAIVLGSEPVISLEYSTTAAESLGAKAS